MTPVYVSCTLCQNGGTWVNWHPRREEHTYQCDENSETGIIQVSCTLKPPLGEQGVSKLSKKLKDNYLMKGLGALIKHCISMN